MGVEVGVEEVVAVAAAVLVGDEWVLVLVADVDVAVAVAVADVVITMEVMLVFELFVDVVFVLGTKTDPDAITSVAVRVACVSGAALIWPSHMP